MDMGVGEIALIAAATTAVSAGVAAYSAHEQGVAASNADKQKARIASEQATQQQIAMRQKMLMSLASQNAQAAAGGASISNANTMRQITQAQNDLMANRAGASAQVSLLDSAASASRSAGDLGAASDLAGGAAKAVSGLPASS
ncbi:MAG TPA: hypothetical protein VGU20_31040 [Stellaceae bacterium]|nr:hypothetical protein [Terriglobia bacterium]HEV2551787.1 hypothetical protein [Stellaceae bacterium]